MDKSYSMLKLNKGRLFFIQSPIPEVGGPLWQQLGGCRHQFCFNPHSNQVRNTLVTASSRVGGEFIPKVEKSARQIDSICWPPDDFVMVSALIIIPLKIIPEVLLDDCRQKVEPGLHDRGYSVLD